MNFFYARQFYAYFCQLTDFSPCNIYLYNAQYRLFIIFVIRYLFILQRNVSYKLITAIFYLFGLLFLVLVIINFPSFLVMSKAVHFAIHNFWKHFCSYDKMQLVTVDSVISFFVVVVMCSSVCRY